MYYLVLGEYHEINVLEQKKGKKVKFEYTLGFSNYIHTLDESELFNDVPGFGFIAPFIEKEALKQNQIDKTTNHKKLIRDIAQKKIPKKSRILKHKPNAK